MTKKKSSNSPSETFIDKMIDGRYQCLSNSIFIKNFLRVRKINKVATIKRPHGKLYKRYCVYFLTKEMADAVLVEVKLLEDENYQGENRRKAKKN